MPAIKGDVIQLEAISPTVNHETASIPLVINTKPTINKFNKNYFKTRVKKTGYGFKNLD